MDGQQDNDRMMEPARKAVAQMRLGWNLGNTFECHGGWFDNLRMETAWGNPITSRELIRLIASLGFGAIRVPVTWYPHMDETGRIDEDWLRRVRRIVRMTILEGMYCIIDSHHDAGNMRSYGGGWIQADRNNYMANRDRAAYMWEQIAEYFAEESDRLLFEGFSGIMNADCEWEMPSEEELEAVNDWNQLFVDTVRATGGVNATRNLIVNPYAAGTSDYILRGFRIPTDPAEGHLIVGLQSYIPLGFTSRAATWARQTDEFDCLCEEELERMFNTIDREFEERPIPIILGEFGSMDRADNTKERAKYVAFVVSLARMRGIPCFCWDDGKKFELLSRTDAKVRYPEIVQAMTTSAGV